jgi:putative membrane protein
MDRLLAALDRDRIRRAVRDAEERTAGEIVPVVVTESGEYEVALWRGAAVLAMAAVTALLLVVLLYEGWGLGWAYTSWGAVLLGLGAGATGAVLTAAVAPLRRRLAGDDRMTETVHRRAMQAFVEEEVFDTRDRTGILLFVSLFEHRIEVLGDAGINRKVDEDDWVEVVARIRQGIKRGNLTEGMADAIGMCGRLLEEKGVEVRPDDEDELSNRVRTPGQNEGDA